ncbi:MAG: hypothetical protein DMF25_09005, partial [Verrucomicrobia bacterium]
APFSHTSFYGIGQSKFSQFSFYPEIFFGVVRRSSAFAPQSRGYSAINRLPLQSFAADTAAATGIAAEDSGSYNARCDLMSTA